MENWAADYWPLSQIAYNLSSRKNAFGHIAKYSTTKYCVVMSDTVIQIGKRSADMPRINELASIMKSLGHPSRLFIVECLAEKPHCVCELTDLIGADTSTVSKHLSVLKNAGVVSDEKRGNLVYYSLACACVIKAVRGLMPLIDQKRSRYQSITK
jgi:ArsR family transcriptional regulator, arsenate/arsenite/antimonite-responsive transcriptional repressor